MLTESPVSVLAPAGSVRAAGMVRQRGVVLMIALIMLVAMTLSGLALLRSVDTTNFIAGNLAFQQAATNYGDVGTNTAAAWLQANSGGTTLYNDDPSNGYSSTITGGSPGAGQSWDNFWTTVLAPGGMVRTLPVDATTGNTVSYVIQRMCSAANLAPTSTAPKNYCAISTVVVRATTHELGKQAFNVGGQTYYRVTSRIAGPRNTVSYIQTIIAI